MTMRTPVTVLTGFLGSGKSTLLSQLLRDPRFSDTAVIINEFGEVALDGALVAHAADQIVQTTTGCLCCTVRGDISRALLLLAARSDAGELPAFARVAIETTGIADPAPVLQTLMRDPRLARRFVLAGVVTTVDAVTGEATLGRQTEALRQVAVADRIVVTKTDLARDPASRRDVERLSAALRALNPGAVIVDRHEPDFDLRALFALPAFDPAAKTMDVRAWLNAGAFDAPDDHRHHHHHHDVNRHGDVRAFCVTLEDPVATGPFTTALELLIARHGEHLLRVKGIACLKERPERPVAFHGVQHVFHDPMILDAWPDQDRRTRMVFITRGLGDAPVRAFFKAWAAAEA
ncbi:MAG: CobW family GTP-binding protein [Rubrimonas sp.]